MERDHVIAIDVGGRVFKVLRPTVMKYPESTLALVLTGKDLQNLVIVDKTYFFDRNPDYFAVVLDYMRNGKLFLPPNLSQEQMLAEAVFWKMSEMIKELQGPKPKARPAAPVEATPPLAPDSPATPPLDRSIAATPPLAPAAPPAQFAPTLLLEDPKPAATLLMAPAPNYQATLLLDQAPMYQPTLPLTTSPGSNIASTLLLDDSKKPNIAPTLLMDAGPGFAPTLLMDEYAKPPAPPSPSMFDDLKPAIAPTLLLEEPPKAATRHPLHAKPPPAIQPTLLLPDPAPGPGTPELPATPKLTDDEEQPRKAEIKPPKRDEVKQPPKKEEAKLPVKAQKDDDLLGSLVKTQDPGPARALPFGGGGKAPGKKGAAPRLKRKRDSSSEGSNKAAEDSYESSFIDDDSDADASEPEEYKPKKKTKKEPKKKVAKAPKKRRGSEEIPAKQPAIVVLLSGFPDKDRKAMEAIVGRLGGTVAENFDQAPSHLVMPEFKRNIKLLVAICQGTSLVKATWLQESQRQGRWVETTNFPLCTPAVEAAHRFRYADTVQRAKGQGTT